MAALNKTMARQFLSRVPDNNIFQCHDSCMIDDMGDLADKLTTMSDETFAYHVNNSKNDFSIWIRDVIGDTELADALRRADTRNEAQAMVANRVITLNKIAGLNKVIAR
jgi:hypothetical protein